MWIPRRFSLILPVLALLAVPARGATLTVLAPASAQPGLKALAADYTAKTGAVAARNAAQDHMTIELIRSAATEVH